MCDGGNQLDAEMVAVWSHLRCASADALEAIREQEPPGESSTPPYTYPQSILQPRCQARHRVSDSVSVHGGGMGLRDEIFEQPAAIRRLLEMQDEFDAENAP